MGSIAKVIEQLFWMIIWVIIGLIVFVFLTRFFENNNVPVLGGLFSWAEQNAGLQG